MLNVNLNYPYPIIREDFDDYKNTNFIGEHEVVPAENGYIITPSFHIENKEIQELLSEGKLVYGIEIQCASTWFRKLYVIQDNRPIRIDSQMLHEKVESIPCIITTASLPEFTNSDFSEEYEHMTFSLNVGDIVAIGQKKTFDAFYQNDIIKDGSSIVKVAGSTEQKEIQYDFKNHIIEITLPQKQYDNYTNCGLIKSKHKILNAILIVPVLMEAIEIIAEDYNDENHNSTLEENTWYKTIEANLKRYAENNPVKYNQLLNSPFKAVEILLHNNYADSLEYLDQIDRIKGA